MRFIREVLEIVRPFGLRRLALISAMIVIQALVQLLTVFSLLPFLSAASDTHAFRASKLGRLFVRAAGDGSDIHLIVLAGAASLAILLIGNLTTIQVEFARSRYAHQLGHWTRTRLIGRLLDRRYEYFTRINTSVLLKHLIEDVGSFAQQILLSSLDVAARILLAALLGLSILLLEPFVFGCALLILLLYSLAIIMPVRRRASETSERIRHNTRELYFEVYQTFSGIRPILANDRRDYFANRCATASANVAAEMPRVTLYGIVPRMGLEILVFGGLIAWVLIAIAYGRNLTAIMPHVGLVALIAYRLMPSLQLIFSQTMTIAANRQALSELLLLFREQESMSAGAPPLGDASGAAHGLTPSRPRLGFEKSLSFDNVSFRYAGADRDSLMGISFHVDKGEHVAFVGATGSGKSTLVDLILGLLQPGAGQIVVDGVPLTPDRMAAWRATVGYVPQDLFLLDGTIAQNVAFGCRDDELDQARVLAVSELASARGFIERKEQGFASRVGERGGKLSGGQRQRLAVARALYAAPGMLVMDEATSALDPNTEERIMANLIGSATPLTIVTVTHRLTTVRDCDRIYFMDQGRIVAHGRYDELTASDAAFRQFAN